MLEHLLTYLLPLIVSAAALWITRALKTPRDWERAQLLALIAEAAAALVVSINPRAPWANLLQETIKQIAAAAGLPIRDRAAIERAAASALAQLGKLPDQ